MAPVFVAGKTSIQAFDFDTKSLERQMKRHSGAGKLLHMKSIWSIYDPYMIHIWSIYDPYMIHIWSIYDPYMIHIWSIYDPYGFV